VQRRRVRQRPRGAAENGVHRRAWLRAGRYRGAGPGVLGETVEPGYAARRRNLLLVAVNCTQAAATCFCTSTGDGPGAGAGADLVITELNPGIRITSSRRSAAGEEMLAAFGGETP
jgi:hypothetical protein